MNVVLIGMPASGKSTVGRILASLRGMEFADGDDLIREKSAMPLSAFLEQRGTEAFLELEEEVLCGFHPARTTVFAPGGSAVYSPRAMESLKNSGPVVYLKTSLNEIESRIPDFSARGVVMRGTISSLAELYAERTPLYERYADITVDMTGLSPEEAAEKISRLLGPRILVYGAGAMGTSLGFFLKERGYESELVTRNRAHVEALKQGGTLILPSGEKTVGLPALLPEEMKGKYDIVILATRQQKNREIARFLEDFLKEDGALVTVQNGLPEEGLAEILGESRIYGAALGWGAEQTEAGVVRVTSEEHPLSLGAYGEGNRLAGLAEILGAETGNLSGIRYSKLVVNAAFSTLSAISGLTFGALARKYGRTLVAIMRETVAVARACGCRKLTQNGHDIGKLSKSPFAALLLPFAMKKHKDIRSGMLKDLEGGRRCDVDFVAGAVVREGMRLSVPTPLLKQAVSLVHDIENGLAEISPETLKFLHG